MTVRWRGLVTMTIGLALVAAPAWGAPARPDDVRGVDREGTGIEPEDVALFAPRAVLFLPARVLQLLNLPLRAGLGFVEEHHVLEHLEDFFYNDARTAAVLPSVSLGSGFGLRAGATAFHEDLGGHGEMGEVGFTLGMAGEQVYLLSFEAPHLLGGPFWVETKTVFEVNPSSSFFGIGDEGPRATRGAGLDPRRADIESFYQHQRFRQTTAAGIAIGDPGLELRTGVRGRLKRHDFATIDDPDDETRPLEEVYDPALVPGYAFGATLAEVEGLAILDTRDRGGATRSGFYAEAFAGGALPFREFEYAHFGGELTGYLEIWRERVLIARLALDAVEGAPEEIPFVELPSLGGAHRLRGYPLHRYRDEKALFGTLEYQYPIHELLAGSLYLDAGEVAPTVGDLFQEPTFHVGGGGGIVFRSKKRVYFTLDVAGGDGVQVYATTNPLRAFADRDDEL